MNMNNRILKLQNLAKLIRYYILLATTEAGSGHLTSSLSAVELMTVLFFGGFFKFNLAKPEYFNNDRLIFSKGQAAPLLYSLYAAAGKISQTELLSLRKFGSRLEGHPTLNFPYAEAATGSLGQGLAVGVGLALNGKYLDKLPYTTFVLLGDSEMSEGSQWEAIQLAAHYKLNNLVGIIDVNRLGQRGETMNGHNLLNYKKQLAAFGWKTILIKNGHNLPEIIKAYRLALKTKKGPVMIIAKTVKGQGIKFLENKNGWHGKALAGEDFKKALSGLGQINKSIRAQPAQPVAVLKTVKLNLKFKTAREDKIKPQSTRKAYGQALVKIFPKFPNMVVLDAEVSNSTYAELFKEKYPERFFEMYIAEQNMVGAALGFSRRGKIPFVSTFAAFWTRAFDQIRMSQYSQGNIKFVGSHAGVSIGEDGASQMGLEDLAMFRTLIGAAVLYPADALACEKLVQEAASYQGNVYLRTTRKDTAIIYQENEAFPIGQSKILKSSSQDKIAVIAAGITLYEALGAYEELKKENILIRVIDLYSIKPVDETTLLKAAAETKAIITVEDHFAQGGLGEAVKSALADKRAEIYSLAVRKIPKSGQSAELLAYEEISKDYIIKKVKEILI
ncbi:MAG: transketolase [Parcubacteria group bacterium]|nr:transketolase [Parcubacteria group bacterium]